MNRGSGFGLLLLVGACNPGKQRDPLDPRPNPEEDAAIFVDARDLGSPIPGLSATVVDRFERGREVSARAFRTDEGLGPSFNADSCASCHQFPVNGGSAPRYRDFFLVRTERWDGALEDAGTNGESPVRNLYATFPTCHLPEPVESVVVARRNAPSTFGIGLLAFVPDEVILENADPSDRDGDGISGRPNYEQGRVGRFGYKSQAANMESFNRGAIFNQMGITTNPVFVTYPEEPAAPGETGAAFGALSPLKWLSPLNWVSSVAHAQVSAPGQPTVDGDGVVDPELGDADQSDLHHFSTYLAAPRPAALDEQGERGAELFAEMECVTCHIPRLESTIGWIPAYSDLLLHNMGEDLADGIAAGLAAGDEFRTQPLFGVVLHGPFLHDGSADTLDEAIRRHGGEGEAARDLWIGASVADQDAVLAFLLALGGTDPGGLHFTAVEAAAPMAGEPGGPEVGLTSSLSDAFFRGRQQFDRDFRASEGLGHYFNADSCRSCHQDPVIGGAGGIDTNVIRYGQLGTDGSFTGLARAAVPRGVVSGERPYHVEPEANAYEFRQPPSILGLGAIDRLDSAVILAGEDPTDRDGDGISGRARILSDGRVGRFGWKAQVPSLLDFAADALLNEVGLTIDPASSTFTSTDDGDPIADPELGSSETADLVTYLEHLGAPVRKVAPAGVDLTAGEAQFEAVGCASCHFPELGGVPAYTDLLLHDIVPAGVVVLDQDSGVSPGEFRTAPLWDIGATPPYLHDGRAPTLEAAIAGHGAEADASRLAFDTLDAEAQANLIGFLLSL